MFYQAPSGSAIPACRCTDGAMNHPGRGNNITWKYYPDAAIL